MQVWIGSSLRPFAFESPCAGQAFALLLIVESQDVTPEEQEALSTQFVRQGCRYAVCYGHKCSSWDDSIDMVCVMDEIAGRATPFVMTTWHEGETLEEVAWHFVHCTAFDDWVPACFVVYRIGAGGGPPELVRTLRSALEDFA